MLNLPLNRTILFYSIDIDYTESFSRLCWRKQGQARLRNSYTEKDILDIAALPKNSITYEAGGRRILVCNQLQHIVVRRVLP